MKIYELAIELELKSVDLLDQLRIKHNMSFKNHMQNVTPEDINKIKAFFKKNTKTSSVVKKKSSTVRKKTATKKATTKKTAKKTAKKTPITKKKVTVINATSIAPKEKPIMRTGIIRRRILEVKKPPQKPIKLDSEANETLTSQVKLQPSDTTDNKTINSVEPSTIKKVTPNSAEESTAIQVVDVAKKKTKKSTLEKETQTTQFRATDFRKREVIFQPKKKRPSIGMFSKKTPITTPKSSKRVMKIYNNSISIGNLAEQLKVKKIVVINKIKEEKLLEDVNKNSVFDYETASVIVSYFNFESINMFEDTNKTIESLTFGSLSAEKQNKPPVVTVMGHVNHGKTTLLDFIRKSRVAPQEAGGITQHMGAYSVPVKNSFVTFIDTPGHAAFISMRKRGAQATDIVILVVAADDGVQPQTIEAINHAKDAKVPIIVAINKMDLPNANIDQTKKNLMEHQLVSEEWGGDTIFCPISALKGDGVEELLEHVQLIAEINELKANPNRSAQGVVIETRVEVGRGFVMNLLVQDGTIKTGQIILCGNQVGRARQMTNDVGVVVLEMGPGMPVEISGFNNPVQVGENFFVVKNEKQARRIILEKKKNIKEPTKQLSIEDLLFKAHESKLKVLNIILKTDAEGSMEALKYSITNLNTKDVETKIVYSSIGDVNESDVLLSKTVSAVLFCFNVKIHTKAQKLIQKEQITLKKYTIIYDLLKDVETLMAGLLDLDIQETFKGRAEVLQVFPISKVGVIAGCKVLKGKMSGDHLVRVFREEKNIYEGKISSLKRFKQITKEVITDQECGIALDKYKDLKVGDIIESFTQKAVKQETLSR